MFAFQTEEPHLILKQGMENFSNLISLIDWLKKCCWTLQETGSLFKDVPFIDMDFTQVGTV